MQVFSSNGIDYQFRIVSGTVLGTDQRSDTRVWGSGSTTIIDGQGSGHTTIDSRVDVVRDLWLKDAQGQEHHYRFNTDIPFREGQDVHCVHLSGRDLAEKKTFDVVYSVYNASVDRYWTLCDTKSLIKTPPSMGASHLVWGVMGNKFLAHAADSVSRASVSLDRFGLTMEQIAAAHRAFVRVAQAISVLILDDSCHVGVVAVPQHDQFENLNLPFVDAEALPTLHQYWDAFTEERDGWHNGVVDELVSKPTMLPPGIDK